jgi:hypothetical protein
MGPEEARHNERFGIARGNVMKMNVAKHVCSDELIIDSKHSPAPGDADFSLYSIMCVYRSHSASVLKLRCDLEILHTKQVSMATE